MKISDWNKDEQETVIDGYSFLLLYTDFLSQDMTLNTLTIKKLPQLSFDRKLRQFDS